MSSYRILYLGKCSPGSTTGHRQAALSRLGHQVTPLHQDEFASSNRRWINRVHYHTGYRLAQNRFLSRLKSRIANQRFDLIWVDSGWWCGRRVAEYLRSKASKLVLLNNDDPTGPGFGLNAGRRWGSLRTAIPIFDLCVIPREFAVAEYQAFGARDVLHRFMGYDEVAHHPARAAEISEETYRHEIVFIGSCMEDRHALLIDLANRGIPLSIYGNGWVNRTGWATLKRYWRGHRIENAEYVAAISRSIACLGMLSKENRDLHTQRSAEIPYAGGVLCGQRTAEHTAMYVEDQEAVFWDTPRECAAKCLRLIDDAAFRESIRHQGRQKVLTLGIGNEQTCAAAIRRLFPA